MRESFKQDMDHILDTLAALDRDSRSDFESKIELGDLLTQVQTKIDEIADAIKFDMRKRASDMGIRGQHTWVSNGSHATVIVHSPAMVIVPQANALLLAQGPLAPLLDFTVTVGKDYSEKFQTLSPELQKEFLALVVQKDRTTRVSFKIK
jgi:hypothetical protein